MTPRPIMDAGPGLNFFASHSERLLFGTLGALCIPETVEQEIRQMARQSRFDPAGRVMSRLTAKYLEVLSDDATDELVRAVTRISGTPFVERVSSPRDLGETMVIAHAAVAAESGSDVIVLIDDRDGRERASKKAIACVDSGSAGTRWEASALSAHSLCSNAPLAASSSLTRRHSEVFTTSSGGSMTVYPVSSRPNC